MKLTKNQTGQGLTEYILIVTLIAVAVIVAVKLFGTKVSNDPTLNAIGTSTVTNTPNH